MNFTVYVIISVLVISDKLRVIAWTSEELELFDLVEDINQNFYEVLLLDQSATVAEIRKAYRRLSLQFHPDKNKEEGAEEKFRRIAAVSEVLKDEERRKQYDLILQNGLPDWRQPIYYYRRVRKMGLFELFIFLSVLLTSGHFILLWAAYWERKYELEEVLGARFKKKKPKKSKPQETSSDEIIASQVNLIPKPAINDLLPAIIVRFLVNFVRDLPGNIATWRNRHQNDNQSDEETSEDEESEENVRKPRKRVKAEFPDYYSLAPAITNPVVVESNNNTTQQQYSEMEMAKPRDWTEHDVILLVKAMNRFPGGTPRRWEKVAASLKRTVDEVSTKVKSLKSSSLVGHPSTSLQGLTGKEDTTLNSTAGPIYEEGWRGNACSSETQPSQKPVENGEVRSSDAETWSQSQQKALEAALLKFPKGCEDRWDQIALHVPGKSKEECMIRYKILVELIRKKKSQTVL